MRSLPRDSLALWIGAAGLWSIFLAFLVLHLVTPSDGTRLMPSERQSAAQGLRLTTLIPGTLQTGDMLLAVSGQSVDNLAKQLTQFDAGRAAPASEIVYTVVRNGRSLDVPVHLGAYPLGVVLASNWGSLLTAVLMQLAGAVVFLKRPTEPAARALFLATASLGAASAWSLGLQVSDITGRLGFWLYNLSAVGGFVLLWAAALHVTLVFPVPWTPLARRPWLLAILYILPYAGLAALTLLAQAPNALAWQELMGAATGYVQGAYSLLALAAAVRAYRAARDPVGRAQTRWVTTAMLITLSAGLIFGVIPEILLGYSLLSWDALAMVGLLVPLAVGAAILRYRLFDIDIILNRTLVYGALTFLVAGLYAVVVGGLGALFQQRGSPLGALLAAVLVAILLQPVRAWLQRGVNRLMYGDRDDPYAVLSRLGRQLEAMLSTDQVLPVIVRSLAEVLKLPYAAVTLREGGANVAAAAFGLAPADPKSLIVVPLHDAGDLIVARRAPDEPFTGAEERLLEDIARQLEAAVSNVRLTADLQLSRERLVTAREEERRRLRRDLHDGLGPTLASHAYRLDAVLDLIDQDPAAARRQIGDLKAQTQTTLADIRRLVYELRPPALDELGLAAALQAQFTDSASGLRIVVEAPPEGLPPLPAAAEVAAYRIAAEAVTNVARHARAHNCQVCLSAGDGALCVQIDDDGTGLPPGARPGVGLLSMRERAAELGGACTIGPRPSGGTRVLARLPLPALDAGTAP